MGLQSAWLLILLQLLLATCSRAQDSAYVTFQTNISQSKFKCCEENEIMYYDTCKLKSEVSFSDIRDLEKKNIPPIVRKKLNCDNNVLMFMQSKCKVTKDEHLLDVIDSKIIAISGQFCIDFVFSDNLTLPIICSKEINNIEFEKKFFFFLLIPSLLFFFITILIYALIKDLNNLHGKSLMCHAAIMCVVIIITMMKKWPFYENESTSCNVFIHAYVYQFSVLATIFWLNVMSFDIWRTFSGNRSSIHGVINKKKKDANKFIIYSTYAWGCPLLISMITCCIEYIPFIKNIVKIRPGFVNPNCWFETKIASFIYLHGPIGILLCTNLLLLLHTTIIIYKGLRRSQNNFNGQEGQKNLNNEKQRFMMYLKLFTISGGTWVGEILSVITSTNSINVYEPPENKYIKTFFDFIDTINSLQGVFVFLIFVCTRSVLVLINKKLCIKYRLFNTNSTKSNNSTNSIINTSSTIV